MLISLVAYREVPVLLSLKDPVIKVLTERHWQLVDGQLLPIPLEANK